MCASIGVWCFWQAILAACVVFTVGVLIGHAMATMDAEMRERVLRQRIRDLKSAARQESIQGRYL